MEVNIQNMTAVQDVEDNQIIGHLVWYSVGKQLIKKDDLYNCLISSGIDDAWMPNAIRSTDAFRRATKEIESKKATGNAGVYNNYLVREVFSDNKYVQRNIVVETVDQQGKRLAYDSEAGIITLDKKNESISVVSDDSVTQEMGYEAEKKFDLYKQHYSAQRLRVMVHQILQSLAPTPVKNGGGIYFVPDSYTEGLSNLVTFIFSLENSEAFKVPVVNTYDNQQMINKKLNDHLESILTECKASVHMKKGQVKEVVNNANAVIKDYKEYKGIISSQASVYEDKIGQIKNEVFRMINNME